MQLKLRHMPGLALAVSLVLSPAEPARAIFGPVPVVDGARFWQMFLMLQNVVRITRQVDAALTRVQNAAASLGGGNLVEDILIGQRYLTSDIRSIGYSIGTVTTQFEQVFPSQDAAPDVSPDDVQDVKRGWDQEIEASGLAAARAQTAVSRMEANTRSAIDILQRSQATTGDTSDEGSHLAKLQALVQMLGIINSDVATLSTTLSTAERVTSDVAAGESSEEALEAARVERMLRQPATPERIPEIDPRILRD